MKFKEVLNRIKGISEVNPKSLIERALKLSEECGELAQAALSYENVSGCGYKLLDANDVQEEAVDCVLVALDIFFQTGGTKADFKELLETKANKWERVLREHEE